MFDKHYNEERVIYFLNVGERISYRGWRRRRQSHGRWRGRWPCDRARWPPPRSTPSCTRGRGRRRRRANRCRTTSPCRPSSSLRCPRRTRPGPAGVASKRFVILELMNYQKIEKKNVLIEVWNLIMIKSKRFDFLDRPFLWQYQTKFPFWAMIFPSFGGNLNHAKLRTTSYNQILCTSFQ